MTIKIIWNRYKVSGSAPVHLDVYIDRRNRMYIHTGVKVVKKDWNPGTNSVKKSNPNHQQYNYLITQARKKVENWYNNCIVTGTKATKQALKAHLEGNDQGITLYKFVNQVFESERTHIAHETERQRLSVVNNLKKYDETTPLSATDYAWVIGYHDHLLKTMKSTSSGKNHKLIKRALTRAIKMGLIKENPYDYFRIPEARKRITFLTPEDLVLLRKYDGPERLNKVRDIFLFQCLTGLSYSDVIDLQPSHIHQRGERTYISNARKKTGQFQIIPLVAEACQLVSRYSDNFRIFPNISNQKMNAYLKEIGTICNISTRLTTHVARHTFATLMLGKGLPLETVSHILGHTSTRITQVYAKVVFEKIEEDFRRLDIKGL